MTDQPCKRCLSKGYQCIVEPVSGPTISPPARYFDTRCPPTHDSPQSPPKPNGTQWPQVQPMSNVPPMHRFGSGAGGGGTGLDGVQGRCVPPVFNSNHISAFPPGTTHAHNYELPNTAWDRDQRTTLHGRSRRTSHQHPPSGHNLYPAPVAHSPGAGTHDYVNHPTGHADDRGRHSDSSGHSPEGFPYQDQYGTAAATQYHPHTMNPAGAGNFYPSGQSARLASNPQNQWSAAAITPVQKYECSRCP
jgi:hypothetical protein